MLKCNINLISNKSGFILFFLVKRPNATKLNEVP